ncbi:hypothetical protein SZ25_00365 [Candidatus Arcanobacter lacustris]|jgi:hypothetical protein|uniref:Uncharacterized protein n=1 Tax=Candidatus Arcanibacter lacustris TaxID=1607817 RepID=A0A0F5MP34_9RICK|nr:hypothetical protein SZ25_00365 [Candidatus Arcanobacter lacustris]
MRREDLVKTAQNTAVVAGGLVAAAAVDLHARTQRLLDNAANSNSNLYVAGAASVALAVVDRAPEISRDLALASGYALSAFGKIALAVFDGACSAYSKVSAQGQPRIESEFETTTEDQDKWDIIDFVGKND